MENVVTHPPVKPPLILTFLSIKTNPKKSKIAQITRLPDVYTKTLRVSAILGDLQGGVIPPLDPHLAAVVSLPR